jgi:hypothetical protein
MRSGPIALVVLVVGCTAGASVMLSTIHPWGNLRSGIHPEVPLMDGVAVPDDVRHVLEEKCGECHSEKTHWPPYSRLAPASWLMESDVHGARSKLNMSAWPLINGEAQVDLLARLAAEARSGAMPPRQYLILHPAARLTEQEQQMIYDWAKAERRRIRSVANARPGASAGEQGIAKP